MDRPARHVNFPSPRNEAFTGDVLTQQSSNTAAGSVPREVGIQINVGSNGPQPYLILDDHHILSLRMQRVEMAEPGRLNLPSPAYEASTADVFSQQNSNTATGTGEGRDYDYHLPDSVSLLHAAIKGDWEAARSVIENNREVVQLEINEVSDTALHVAAAAKHVTFVEQLVEYMTSSQLAKKNRHGDTAFSFAAASGIVKTARAMYRKNRELPMVLGCGARTPLYVATLFGHREMTNYLYEKTEFNELNGQQRIGLLHVFISADFHDLALKILEKDPSLAFAREYQTRETALHVLARMPSAIATNSELGIWKKSVNSCFKGIYHQALMQTFAYKLVEKLWELIVRKPEAEISNLIGAPSRLLFDAVKLGNVQFLLVLFRSYPNLLWSVDEEGRTLFQIAVINRQESVFNIIYGIGAIKDLIASCKDQNYDNMLHMAGHLAPPERLQVVSGAALQMQRELLWFKAVEKLVPPSYVNMKNFDRQRAKEIFSKTHQELLKDGEKWMKHMAEKSMLVATLITTVVFAAAFTVPGGNNSETGTPIFQRENWFTIFIILDAAALFTSTFSIIVFFSILTSRFREEDFVWSLPSRLIFGLSALFISIATMVLAFSAIFFLVYDHKLKWIPFLLISLAVSQVIVFGFLHFHPWYEIIRSIFRSKFLFRPHKCMRW